MTLQLAERLPLETAARFRRGLLAIPSLFATEEIAWLGEEAKLISARLSGRPRQDADGALIDIDVHEEPFRRLASHPRLLEQVRRVLDEPFGILRTRLTVGETDGDAAPAGVTVAVQLGGERGPLYVITYAPVSRATRRLEAGLTDDCLWPPAFACAG